MPLDSTILAIKEFSCAYICVDCRMDIPVDSSPISRIVRCSRCSSVLQQVAVQTNSCKILLNNKQWFSVHSLASLLLTNFTRDVTHQRRTLVVGKVVRYDINKAVNIVKKGHMMCPGHMISP